MRGKVIIVGAGIGDPDLITLRGKMVLEEADVIIYDRLLNSELIRPYSQTAELFYVGKRAADHALTQDEINDLMVEKAKEGKKVVRLKGGDPYVFGRGGEEVEYLVENGVDFEVVPGVTAGVVSLMYAGIPATHRDVSTSVSFITGQRKTGVVGEFTKYGKLDGTLVFYMGLGNLKKITDDLMEGGMAPDTPAAVIMNGGYPEQRVYTSVVSKLAGEIENLGFGSPSLIVIGKVVDYREKLNFYENSPLFGKSIIITRARTQSSILAAKLKELGAKVTEAPTIEIKPVNGELLREKIRLFDYTHLVFNSANAVELFMDEFKRQRDLRDLAGVKICVVGEKTSLRLRDYGLIHDIMPGKYVGEELTRAIVDDVHDRGRVFLPHSALTRKDFFDEIREVAELDEMTIYDNVMPKEPAELPDHIDYIMFTSSSTVTNFIKLYGLDILKCTKLISIGPITTKAIENAGLNIYRESEVATIDSMIDAVRGN